MDSSKAKLIDNYIYFFHIDKFCILPMYPDSISDNLASNFSSVNALSRTAPVFTYVNSGPRTMSITLKMHRDMMEDINRNVSNLKSNVVDFSGDDYVDTLIKHLQSAALPRYQIYTSGSKAVIPPMVAVRFGNDIFIKGVVNGGVQVQYEKPILVGSKYAQVTVTFTVSETDPYDADTVLAEGSFRGITRTFKDGVYKSNYVGPNLTTTNDNAAVDLNKPGGIYTNNPKTPGRISTNKIGHKKMPETTLGPGRISTDKIGHNKVTRVTLGDPTR